MRDIWLDLSAWIEAGKEVALATAISVEGAALRSAGSKFALTKGGEIAGSVSGGCIEGDLFEKGQAVLRSGAHELASYGIADETAWEAGLTCGGALTIFIESLQTEHWRSVLPMLKQLMACDGMGALVTITQGSLAGDKLLILPDGSIRGSLPGSGLETPLITAARECWRRSEPVLLTLDPDGQPQTAFVDVLMPAPKLVIIGAVHIAIELVHLANTLGFQTIVVDPRAAFATRDRFPHAAELHKGWPQDILPALTLDPATFVACLTHDEKIDIPALQIALEAPVRYIGVLGSKKTHAHRLESMRALGCDPGFFQRIHAPIGLDLGRREPAEIALSIMAEIVAVKNGRPSNTSGMPPMS